MPIGPCLASFKNSRVYPRPATIAADTGIFDTLAAGLGGSPNGNTIARPANDNRTYLSLRNESTTLAIRYGYEDRVSLEFDGFLLLPGQAIDIESPQEIYTVLDAGGVGTAQTGWDEGVG